MRINPGMLAQVKIPCQDSREVIQIPIECIISDHANTSFIDVIDNSTKGSSKGGVSLGRILGYHIEFLSGLKARDRKEIQFGRVPIQKMEQN